MELNVREVGAKDRAAIESIIRENENFTDEEKWCAVELLDIYLVDTRKGEYLFICAVDETDIPRGYLCYGKTPFADGVYDIYWIAIEPRWQGKRVGKVLVRHVENILKEWGARMVVAETSSQPKYDKTRAFYEKVGFSETARIKDFYRPGDDKVVYIMRFKRHEPTK